jgi:hypothetical protein
VPASITLYSDPRLVDFGKYGLAKMSALRPDVACTYPFLSPLKSELDLEFSDFQGNNGNSWIIRFRKNYILLPQFQRIVIDTDLPFGIHCERSLQQWG